MEWREVAGSNGDYFVSDSGDVKSFKAKRPRVLKKRISRDGYVWYVLQINGEPKTSRANRLVAEAFIPNPENKNTVNHKDGNKLSNCVSNLEWATRSEQMKHAYAHHLKSPVRGILQGNHVLSEDEVREIRNIYKSHDKAFGMIPLAKRFNVSISTINKCIGKRSYKNVK
jgi:hypothetical protein